MGTVGGLGVEKERKEKKDSKRFPSLEKNNSGSQIWSQNSSITWKCVRNANYWALLQTAESESVRVWPSKLQFNKPTSCFQCRLTCENHSQKGFTVSLVVREWVPLQAARMVSSTSESLFESACLIWLENLIPFLLLSSYFLVELVITLIFWLSHQAVSYGWKETVDKTINYLCSTRELV